MDAVTVNHAAQNLNNLIEKVIRHLS